MTIVNWYEICLFVFTFIAILLQLYVIVLVKKETPPSMKSYSWFLIQYTIWDMLFTATLGFAMGPDFPSQDIAGAFVNGFARYFGKYAGNVSLAFMVFCVSAMLITLAECLIYRMMVVRADDDALKIFLKPSTLVIVSIVALSIAAAIAVACYFALMKPEDYPNLYVAYWKKISDYPWLLEKLQDDTSVAIVFDGHSTYVQVFFIIVFGLFTFYEVISFAIAWSILYTLRQNSQYFSPKTYKMHRQLTFLLIGQLLTPIICNILPISLIVLSIVADFRIASWNVQLMILTMTLYAPVNSLMTIHFVTPYRKFTYAKIDCKSNKSSRTVNHLVFDKSSVVTVTKSNQIFTLHTMTTKIWDMLFAASLGFVLGPDFSEEEISGAFMIGIARYFGKNAGNIAYALMTLCITAMLIALAECLIYRWLVVRSNDDALKIFLKPSTLVIVSVVALSIAASNALASYFLAMNPEDYANYIAYGKKLSEYPWVWEKLQDDFSVVFIYDTGSTLNQIYFVSGFALFILYEVISFAIAWSILYTLRQNSQYFSPKTYKMHRQLTFLLIGQLLTPIICIVLPISVHLMSILFHFRITSWNNDVTMLTQALYASVNSLMIILSVTPYRKYTFAKIACWSNKPSRIQPADHVLAPVPDSSPVVTIARPNQMFTSHPITIGPARGPSLRD
ncbi:serpentine type 7TM GPCR chemoreceptor srh domain-containing protein [Ditylenchus destructor]|uniref:Serpentine type 7TM GPCR chemoreceptor srh domain-containing protein n=1 Tax=Ditylenchus destructor TaxID=166010 RepID=A0AAD4QWX7_9BILA|nr:serpentine type 7TM GPCR chemoreceptor srh domain-containing protein [Ditylenchus destructor]